MAHDQNIVSTVWRMLAYAYGAVLILIGLDKTLHTNIIVDWPRYISPLAHSVIPVSDVTFLTILGIAEVVVGIMFFTRWVRLAGVISLIVLALIIVNLLSMGYGFYDIAARDLLIALGAIAVVRLSALDGYILGGKTT